MFEVEYLWYGWVKKRRMESTPILSYAIGLTLDTPIDFAFSPGLSLK